MYPSSSQCICVSLMTLFLMPKIIENNYSRWSSLRFVDVVRANIVNVMQHEVTISSA